jgi:hypothetical protein
MTVAETELFGPEVKPATEISVSVTAADIALTLGVARQLIDPVTGHPAGARAIEWQTTYALSATTALSLKGALEKALEVYVQQYGEIPKDSSRTLDEKNIPPKPE